MIKILYLITGLNTGGAEVFLRDLNKRIDRNIYEIKILSLISVGSIGKQIQKDGGDVLTINTGFKYNPFLFIKLIFFIKKYNPDILHAHLFHANFLGRIAGKLCKVPIIISTFHSNKEEGFFRRKLLKYTDKFTNINIVVSEKAVEEFTELKIVSKDKTRVIYNGLDLNKFYYQNCSLVKKTREEIRVDETKKILISVGRLHKSKGYSYLINAFKIVKKNNPETVLIIIGEGEERKKIEKQINALKLQDSVFLLGQKDNVQDYLSAANVFILSSLWEGIPIALAEAMACGLPVVVTAVGGIPEVVENGKTGFLVEPKNSEALAEKIEYALNLSGEERKKISRHARKKVEETSSIEETVKKYENLYKELILKK